MKETTVRLLRKSAGMTGRRFAQLLDVDQSSVSFIELRRRPSWPKLRQSICLLLNVDEAELFDQDGFAILSSEAVQV